ncbi:MAG: PfkB family carbohydrate kinase [Desulfurococcaceae archaeon]
MGSDRIVLYGNPTLDVVILGGRAITRMGGGVYYGLMGLEGVAEVEVRSACSPAVFLDQAFQARVTCPELSSHVDAFRLVYSGTRRQLEVLSIGNALTSRCVHEGVADAVVMNPVIGEVGADLVAIARLRAKLLVADAQGFVRIRSTGPLRLGGEGSLEILGLFDVVHMDYEEAMAATGTSRLDDALKVLGRLRTSFVVTNGVEPAFLIMGSKVASLEHGADPVDDPTGAGDYLTSRLAVRYMELWDIVEATYRALEDTEEWLRRRPHRPLTDSTAVRRPTRLM